MKKFLGIVLILLLIAAVTGFAQKKFAGKSIRLLYFAATYAEAAKEYSKEFEEKTGCKVEVVEFPYLTLYEKMGLSLSTGDSSYDIVTPACQWDGEFEPFMVDLAPLINIGPETQYSYSQREKGRLGSPVQRQGF